LIVPLGWEFEVPPGGDVLLGGTCGGGPADLTLVPAGPAGGVVFLGGPYGFVLHVPPGGNLG